MNKDERLIQIPLEEYKELLIIKRRYEELAKKSIILPNPKINLNGIPIQEFEKEYDTYKITCNTKNEVIK